MFLVQYYGPIIWEIFALFRELEHQNMTTVLMRIFFRSILVVDTISGARGDLQARFRRELVKNCLLRYHSFTQKIINSWNALSHEYIEVVILKPKLDRPLRSIILEI